jgi:hypothetical protein
MFADILAYLIPPAILVLLILAPRRGGRARRKGSNALAAVVAIWAVASILIAVLWEHYGIALLWRATNAP